MTPTDDAATVPRSRRSLLKAAAGAAAAKAATARARPLPAAAAPGDPFNLGQENFSATRSGRATVSAGRPSVDIDPRSKGGLPGAPLCFWSLDGRPEQAPTREGS
jgi:hypothetical protein